MLLYFSATGNCKYATLRLAQAAGEEALSIVDCLREGRYAFADSAIGIVVPTYFWGLPSIVREFLGKASFQTEYLYFVATYGTTPGGHRGHGPGGHPGPGDRRLLRHPDGGYLDAGL